MRDRASVNDVAMERLSGDFPSSEDIKCLSHTLDHVGDKFRCDTLTRFFGVPFYPFQASKDLSSGDRS